MTNKNLPSFIIFTIILSIAIFTLFYSENYIHKMNFHFHNNHYQKAIYYADLIIKDQSSKSEEIKKAYIVRGASEYLTNQTLNAKITFLDLLMLDHNIKLNSKELTPKIIHFFNSLKQKFNKNGFS